MTINQIVYKFNETELIIEEYKVKEFNNPVYILENTKNKHIECIDVYSLDNYTTTPIEAINMVKNRLYTDIEHTKQLLKRKINILKTIENFNES